MSTINIFTTRFHSIKLLIAILLIAILQESLVFSQFTNQDEVFNVVNEIDSTSTTEIDSTSTTEIASLESTAESYETGSNNIFNVNGVVGGRYASFGGYPFYVSILVFNVKKAQVSIF